MHVLRISIAVVISCYLNLYSKAIHTFSMKDSILKVPFYLEGLLKRSQAHSHTGLENEYMNDVDIDAFYTKQNVDFRGLYSTLKHYPELMDRRLKIGGLTPPPLPKDDLPSIQKRFDIGVAQSSCPIKTEWVRLHHARDINNTHVEVFQPNDNNPSSIQWFYTVTCDYDLLTFENSDCPRCCRAVNHMRFSSRCVPRQSYVMALIRKSRRDAFDWGYIHVDSSCNCAVIPKL